MPVTTGPSGLALAWREMAMEDEDTFAENAEKSEANQAQAFDELLSGLLVGIRDRKHYRSDDLTVDAMLSGDRTKYLVDVRNDAFDSQVEVIEECPAGHAIEQVVDLACLALEPLTKASAKALADGTPLSFTLPRSGRVVQWQMLTGHLETAMLDVFLGTSKARVSETVAVRIVDVDGFDDAGMDKKTKQDLRGWLKKLHTRDSRALRQHIANNECGVQTLVTIPCQRSGCRRKIKVDMLAHPDFFPLAVQREDSIDSSTS